MAEASNPSTYGQGYHPTVLRSHQWRTALNSAAYLLPHLKPSMKILDIGCGPGTLTLSLATYVPSGMIIGIDHSAEVIKIAQSLMSSTSSPPTNMAFQAGDVYALNFPDETFDVVHAHQVLQHLSRPVDALKEMMRVTKTGGFVAVREADSQSFTWYPASLSLSRWHAVYQDLARNAGGEPDAGRRLKAWAHEAGFLPQQVRCSASTWCFASEEDRKWWGGMWADRITNSESWGDRAIEQGLVGSLEELEEIGRGWQQWVDNKDAWFGMMHGEIICEIDPSRGIERMSEK